MERPLLVVLRDTVVDFPLSFDGDAFISTFGSILIPAPAIQKLAVEILYSLTQKHNGKGFLGVHLSADADAKDGGWADVEKGQTYLSLAKGKGLGVIYISSTEASALKEFSSLAGQEPASTTSVAPASKGIRVIRDKPAQNTPAETTRKIDIETSSSILSSTPTSPEFLAFKEMDTNQLLLLDYLVLSHATYFAGIGGDNFSWAVTGHRSLSLDGKDGKAKAIWNYIPVGGDTTSEKEKSGKDGKDGGQDGGQEEEGTERQKVVMEKFEDVVVDEKGSKEDAKEDGKTSDKGGEEKGESKDTKEGSEDGAKDDGKVAGKESKGKEDKSKDGAKENGDKDEDKANESNGESEGKDKSEDAEKSEDELWKASLLAGKNATATESAGDSPKGSEKEGEETKTKTADGNDGDAKEAGKSEQHAATDGAKEHEKDGTKQEIMAERPQTTGSTEVEKNEDSKPELTPTSENEQIGGSASAEISEEIIKLEGSQAEGEKKEDAGLEDAATSESEELEGDDSSDISGESESEKGDIKTAPAVISTAGSSEEDNKSTPPAAGSEEISTPEGTALKDEQMKDIKPVPTAPSISETLKGENEGTPPDESSEPTTEQEDSRLEREENKDNKPENTPASEHEISKDDKDELTDDKNEGTKPESTPASETKSSTGESKHTSAVESSEPTKDQEDSRSKNGVKKDITLESTPAPELKPPTQESNENAAAKTSKETTNPDDAVLEEQMDPGVEKRKRTEGEHRDTGKGEKWRIVYQDERSVIFGASSGSGKGGKEDEDGGRIRGFLWP